MSQYILSEVILYLVFFVFLILKQQRSVSDTKEFLSLGSFDSAEKTYQLLGKTFEASNASFATTFVGLFAIA
ncbi:MAG: hypothetical protein KZQ83_19765 [gamma proteobacterium symbiont of Taylorina sp.]|nr:hypothetical protein [gamma proteobacterium symbiont of Taylorina sp.]